MSDVLVETYETTETTTGEPDPLDPDSVELINKLGLTGQQRYLADTQDPDTQKVVPYRLMTDEEHRVYKTLFPAHTSLEKYDGEPIPLRVLQVAAHAETLTGLDTLEVWHPKVYTSDPILVAKVKHPEYGYRYNYFLLARWGKALEDFETLRQKAAEMLREKWVAKAKKVKAEAEKVIEGDRDQALAYLSHGEAEPSYY